MVYFVGHSFLGLKPAALSIPVRCSLQIHTSQAECSMSPTAFPNGSNSQLGHLLTSCIDLPQRGALIPTHFLLDGASAPSRHTPA